MSMPARLSANAAAVPRCQLTSQNYSSLRQLQPQITSSSTFENEKKLPPPRKDFSYSSQRRCPCTTAFFFCFWCCSHQCQCIGAENVTGQRIGNSYDCSRDTKTGATKKNKHEERREAADDRRFRMPQFLPLLQMPLFVSARAAFIALAQQEGLPSRSRGTT